MSRSAICLVFAFAVATPALAGNTRPPTTIDSVIVYPAGASVVRTVPIDLPAGASMIVVDGLPTDIEADSITVDGIADGRLEIGSVATDTVPAGRVADPARQSILDEIRNLEDERAIVADRIGALDGRRRFIEKMLETLPQGFGEALGAANDYGGFAQWSAASRTLGDELDAVAISNRALQREDRALAERLDERVKALGDIPSPRDSLELRIELAAAAPLKGTLTIGYRTPSAWWAPSYHALLTTRGEGGEPSLTIVRRAEVTQSTGEDWSDVDMTLSTARPAIGTAAPFLHASLAGFDRGYGESGGYAHADKQAAPSPAPSARSIYGEDAVAALAADQPAVSMEAIADFGDFRADYAVPGRVSLASGEGSRAFRIATETGAPELEVRAVPVLSSAAYLTARFIAPSTAPYLAGKVSLFRDGSFVGLGSIPFVNGGTKVDLGFGVDDRVKVTRTAIDRAMADTGILTRSHTDTRRFRIKVENLHETPMKITVLDRVPYSQDAKIIVERLDEGTRPSAEDVDDQRGVLAWTYTYDGGESRDIRNGYKVTWPEGEQVVLAD